jgi:GNAT superfamily N-acetyltransferase
MERGSVVVQSESIRCEAGVRGAAAAADKIRTKYRQGLLQFWVFERLTNALARFGVTVHSSVIYQEGEVLSKLPEPQLAGCEVGFATAEDLPEISEVEGYPMGVHELKRRVCSGAGCCLLRHRGRIVAFTWYEVGGRRRPRLGISFAPSEAYLFDAHTAPGYRGRNLLPFLRFRLYEELRRIGCTGLWSSTAVFNRPAHRFKEKLGARPREVRLYVRILGRIEKVFVVWHYSVQ